MKDGIMNEVSVIITVYNGEKYISQAIESIINQTVSASEIIVIDDGSIDSTREIINHYPQVKYFYQKNMGVSAARNRGIKEARCEFLTILDHDDFFPKNKIELIMPHFIQNPELDVVRGLYECHFETPEMEKMFTRLTNISKNHHSVLLGTAVFKRSIFDKVGLFDTNLKSAEDVDIWIRLNAHAKVKNINELCLYYRQHIDSTMKVSDFARHNAMNLIEIVKRKIQNERGIK